MSYTELIEAAKAEERAKAIVLDRALRIIYAEGEYYDAEDKLVLTDAAKIAVEALNEYHGIKGK